MSALTKISPEQVYNSLLLTEANKTAVVSGKEINSSQVKIFKSSLLNRTQGGNDTQYQYGICWIEMSDYDKCLKWIDALKGFSLFFGSDNSTAANTNEAVYLTAAKTIVEKYPTVLPFELMEFYRLAPAGTSMFEERKKSFTGYTVPFFINEVHDYYLGRLKLVRAAEELKEMQERERTIKLSETASIDPFQFYANETKWQNMRITHSKAISELQSFKDFYELNKKDLFLSAAKEFIFDIGNILLYKPNEIIRYRKLLDAKFVRKYNEQDELVYFECIDKRSDLYAKFMVILQTYSTFKFIKHGKEKY